MYKKKRREKRNARKRFLSPARLRQHREKHGEQWHAAPFRDGSISYYIGARPSPIFRTMQDVGLFTSVALNRCITDELRSIWLCTVLATIVFSDLTINPAITALVLVLYIGGLGNLRRFFLYILTLVFSKMKLNQSNGTITSCCQSVPCLPPLYLQINLCYNNRGISIIYWKIGKFKKILFYIY